MLKICVTGGCGFIGSSVIAILNELGHEIIAIDNLSTGLEEYLTEIKNVTILKADILDLDLIIKFTVDIDAVIHLAASGNVMDSLASPLANFDANVRGTLNVLEACRLNKINRIIFSSTGGALMGDAPLPVNETTIPNPISPYGASKLSCENYIKVYSLCYGIDYTILRFGNVIGPNCYHKKGVLNKFYQASISNNYLKVFDNPSRDFVGVKDLAYAICQVLEVAKSTNNIFHLASGLETPIYDVAKVFQRKFGFDPSRIVIDQSRTGEIGRNYSDTQKAKEILGWKPNLDITSLIEETIDWLDEFVSDQRI